MSSLGRLYLLATFLCVVLGLAHSYLGERLILRRLFRRPDLPKLFGGTEFTTRTLRFAWHLTSLTWWGMGALFFLMAQGPITSTTVAAILSVVFLLSAGITLVASRGRHFAWAVFLVVGLIALYGSKA